MGRKRNIQIKFFLSDEENKKLENKLEKLDLNKSEYLRKCSLDKKIIVVDGFKELAKEISRIGNNLNQITKAVNQGIISDSKALNNLKGEYKKVFNEIYEISKKVR